MLYQFDSSREYDPSPHLERITTPVLAINSADDQINPPELGLMEALMPRVKRGIYVLIPISERTRGHATHTWAALWREHLATFMSSPAPMGKAAVAGGSGGRIEVGDPGAAKEVEVHERALIAAIGGRDLGAYDRLVADDYVALGAAGDQTKAQILSGYRDAALVFRGLEIHDVEVRVLGDTATQRP